MNYLVLLNEKAGELEKILSGIKCMLIKDYDPAQAAAQVVSPGDSLYFLRNNGECDLRVKATVTRILTCGNEMDEDLSRTLKELQPRLQLTEEQYNYWSSKNQILLVEFGSAQKISVIHVSFEQITSHPAWTAFEAFSTITGEKVSEENLVKAAE